MKVAFVDYEGAKVPFRISYLSLSAWQKETGKGLSDLDNIDSDMSMIAPLFYHSVIVGYKALKDVNPYSPEEIKEEILDVCWTEFLAKLPDFFQEGNAQIPAKKAKKTK